jgi:Outer membrane protein beta-barrel domain
MMLAAAALTIATSASAQKAGGGPTYGLQAGSSIPFGDLGDAVSIGFHGGGFVEARPEGFPFKLRGDAQFVRFGGKDGGESLNVIQGTGNAVFDFPTSGGKKSPAFAIAGIGFYRSSSKGGDSSTDFGFNLGGGFNFSQSSAYKPFIDGRIHFVDDSEYIGITVGFRF